MNPSHPKQWYYTIPSVIFALLLFGPFAFPLLWRSSQFNKAWKIGLTISVSALTFYLIYVTWYSVAWIFGELKGQGLI